jgi:hypothetical protein
LQWAHKRATAWKVAPAGGEAALIGNTVAVGCSGTAKLSRKQT